MKYKKLRIIGTSHIAKESLEEVGERFAELGIKPWAISAATGEGIKELVRRTGRMVEALGEENDQ